MRFFRYFAAGICLLAVAAPIAAQTAAKPVASIRIPRAGDGKPDLQGIWKVQGKPAVGEILYQAGTVARKADNLAKLKTADPVAKCYMPGVPRIMSMDYAFQIFQTPTHIAQTFEWSQLHRLIYTNGTSAPQGIEFWMGDSRGRWDGDTLVVDVTNHNDRTWLDAAGDFHSDALHVTERYSLVDADTIRYEATLEDPNVYTRPWTMAMVFRRQKDLRRLPEYQCAPEQEEKAGLFVRESRTWAPDAAGAAQALRGTLPATSVVAQPDFQGYFNPQAPGANFGLEEHPAVFGIPAGRGFIIDPPDHKLPMQDWAKAEKQGRMRPDRGYDDPAAHCFPNGLPRTMYTGGFQVLQPPGYVVFLFQGDTGPSYRIINLNARSHVPERVHLWQGDSIGQWDGNTLVVDTTNLNGKAWMNQAGEPLSYQAKVVERFTRVDADTIDYQATITDPVAYTRPWTIAYQIKRSNDELLEVACREDNSDLEHLKQIKDAAAQGGRGVQGR